MIAAILEWLLSFFQKKTKKQEVIEAKIEEKEQELEEIENEEISDDDVIDYLNK